MWFEGKEGKISRASQKDNDFNCKLANFRSHVDKRLLFNDKDSQ